MMTSDVLIRKAEDRDASAIATLITQLGYPQNAGFAMRRLEELSRRESSHIFVAEQDENVVGFLSLSVEPAFHREGNIGTITAMCVLEGQRGRGIGHALIEYAETQAKEAGCVRLAVASGIQRTET